MRGPPAAAPNEPFLLRGFAGARLAWLILGAMDNGRRAGKSLSPSQAGLYWNKLAGDGRRVERWKMCSLKAWLP